MDSNNNNNNNGSATKSTKKKQKIKSKKTKNNEVYAQVSNEETNLDDYEDVIEEEDENEKKEQEKLKEIKFKELKSIEEKREIKAVNNAHISLSFIRRFFRILDLSMPSPFYKQKIFWYWILVMFLAVPIAMLSFNTIIGTKLIFALINNNRKDTIYYFCLAIFFFLLPVFAIVLSVYLMDVLGIEMRKVLSIYLHERYLRNKVYFEMNLFKRIDNPDQRITEDAPKLLNSVAFLVPRLSNSVLVLIFCAYLLIKIHWFLFFTIAATYTVLLILLFIFSYFKINMNYRFLLRNGNFRFSHIKIRTSAESIAFLNGEAKELDTMTFLFKLVQNSRIKVYIIDLLINFLISVSDFASDNLFLISIFVLVYTNLDTTFAEFDDPSKFASKLFDIYFIFMLAIQFGIQYILGTYGIKGVFEQISEIVTRSSRIGELIETFDDIEKEQKNYFAQKQITLSSYTNNKLNDDELLKVIHVSCSNPSGDLIFNNFSFTQKRNQSTMISGVSGSGKSSLLRCISGLWRYSDGAILKPELIGNNGVLCAPQRPYLFMGNLRDLITYPSYTSEDFGVVNNIYDEELLKLLEMVNLQYLVKQYGGFDSVHNWAEVLSIGEQQRIAAARVFYHKPDLAILDECTSAVDVPTEQKIFQNLIERNVTTLSVAHRKTVKAFHNTMLRLGPDKTFDLIELETTKTNSKNSNARASTSVESGSLHSFSRVVTIKDRNQAHSEPDIEIIPQIKKKDEFVSGNVVDPDQQKEQAQSKPFLTNLGIIFRILMPSFFTFTTVKYFIITFTAIYKTVATFAGSFFISYLIKALVSKQPTQKLFTIYISIVFLKLVFDNLGGAIKSNICYEWIKKLTNMIHKDYFKNRNYYRIQILSQGSVDNADQRITGNIPEFAEKFQEVVANSIPDACTLIISVILLYIESWVFPVVCVIYTVITFLLVINALKQLGGLHYVKEKAEAEFRLGHSNIIQNAEPIAFIGGERMERLFLNHRLGRAVLAQRDITNLMSFKLNPIMFTSSFGSIFLYIFILALVFAFPAISPAWQNLSFEETVAKIFLINSLCNSYFKAVEIMIRHTQEFSNIMSSSTRVAELIEVFEKSKKEEEENKKKLDYAKRTDENLALGPNEIVKIVNLQVNTPLGKTLYKNFNLTIEKNRSILVYGASGIGRSSLLRTISDLWTPAAGQVICPRKIGRGGIFYLPQRSYIFQGSLRENILYPSSMDSDSFEISEDVFDEHLFNILKQVNLTYLVKRSGWDGIRDWPNELSLGEAQRVAMARLFFHAPKFAILDEATSAVDGDIEAKFYFNLKNAGVTYISIAHNETLGPWHSQMLMLKRNQETGEFNYTISEIEHNKDDEVAYQLSDSDN